MLRATIYKEQVRRVVINESYGLELISFGQNNTYPNTMYQLALSSGNMQKALKVYNKFIKGSGFANQQFANSKVNDKQTANHLLSDVVKYLALFNGFYLHLNYNLLGQVVSIKCIPFQNVRLGFGANEGKALVWDNWANDSYRVTSYADVDYIDLYDPDPEIIAAQIEACGGITNYKGQILPCFNTDEIYPLTTFESIAEVVETDVRKKNFMRNSVKNNFSAGLVIEYPGQFTDEQERLDFINTIQSGMGDENAGGVIVIENPLAIERPLNFNPVTYQNADKLFVTLEKVVRDTIRSNYLIPSVLLSEMETGLFNEQQMVDAYTYYNRITNDERNFISDCMAKVFANFWVENNIENDFSISPLTLLEKKEETTKQGTTVKTGSAPTENTLRTTVGGITGILEIQRSVAEGITSRGAAITLLKELFDFDETTAQNILQ